MFPAVELAAQSECSDCISCPGRPFEIGALDDGDDIAYLPQDCYENSCSELIECQEEPTEEDVQQLEAALTTPDLLGENEAFAKLDKKLTYLPESELLVLRGCGEALVAVYEVPPRLAVWLQTTSTAMEP